MSATSTTYPNVRRTSANRLFIITPLVLLAASMGILGARARVPDNVIAPGVQVGSVKLGGKTIEEARALLQPFAEERQAAHLAMHFSDEAQITKTWTADAHKMGLGLDIPATLDEAVKAGRENLLGQVSHLITGAAPVVVPAHITVDAVQLRAYLKQIAYAVNHKPRNARLQLHGKAIVAYLHDRPGLSMDVDGSAATVTQAWTRFNATGAATAAVPSSGSSSGPEPSASGSGVSTTHEASGAEREQQATSAPLADPNAHQKPGSPGAEGAGKLDTDTKPLNPSHVSAASPASVSTQTSVTALDVQLLANITPAAVTYADIKQIDGVLGSKETDIGGTANRHSNVALAASRINGTLLRPGEVFSYNKTVGPRDVERGFKEAPEIVRGVLKPGIGGGVCQVSSTLYNAVLRSSLKIVDRSHHAFPVHYVSKGLDATVVDGDIDFKFQNDSIAPVYVYALGRDGTLTFRVYGKTVPGRSVKLVHISQSSSDYDTETESDSTLPAGHREVKVPGHPRIDVTWQRVVEENGVVVKRETLTTHYHAIPEVVIVGTRARPTVSKPASKTPVMSPTPNTAAPDSGAATAPVPNQ